MALFNEATTDVLDIEAQELSSNNTADEIIKLEKIIDDSLIEIKSLQTKLANLETDLNSFLDRYYGASSLFFKNHEKEEHIADNDNGIDIEQATKDIYEKIAKVCSQDILQIISNNTNEGLLKIEGYLADGSDKSQSPQDLLSNLIFECSALMTQIKTLKEKKQLLLDNAANELKQEVMWANIKTSETISRIKEDLTHHINRLN